MIHQQARSLPRNQTELEPGPEKDRAEPKCLQDLLTHCPMMGSGEGGPRETGRDNGQQSGGPPSPRPVPGGKRKPPPTSTKFWTVSSRLRGSLSRRTAQAGDPKFSRRTRRCSHPGSVAHSNQTLCASCVPPHGPGRRAFPSPAGRSAPSRQLAPPPGQPQAHPS